MPRYFLKISTIIHIKIPSILLNPALQGMSFTKGYTNSTPVMRFFHILYARCSLNILFFSQEFSKVYPLPLAIGCTKNQPIGVTVHSHCVESLEGLLKRCVRFVYLLTRERRTVEKYSRILSNWVKSNFL